MCYWSLCFLRFCISFFFNSGFIYHLCWRLSFILFLVLIISLSFKADVRFYFLQYVFKNVRPLLSYPASRYVTKRDLDCWCPVALHTLKVWMAWLALNPLTTAEIHPPYFELATLLPPPTPKYSAYARTHTHTTRIILFSEVGFAKCTTVRTWATQEIRCSPKFICPYGFGACAGVAVIL